MDCLEICITRASVLSGHGTRRISSKKQSALHRSFNSLFFLSVVGYPLLMKDVLSSLIYHQKDARKL